MTAGRQYPATPFPDDTELLDETDVVSNDELELELDRDEEDELDEDELGPVVGCPCAAKPPPADTELPDDSPLVSNMEEEELERSDADDALEPDVELEPGVGVMTFTFRNG